MDAAASPGLIELEGADAELVVGGYLHLVADAIAVLVQALHSAVPGHVPDDAVRAGEEAESLREALRLPRLEFLDLVVQLLELLVASALADQLLHEHARPEVLDVPHLQHVLDPQLGGLSPHVLHPTLHEHDRGAGRDHRAEGLLAQQAEALGGGPELRGILALLFGRLLPLSAPVDADPRAATHRHRNPALRPALLELRMATHDSARRDRAHAQRYFLGRLAVDVRARGAHDPIEGALWLLVREVHVGVRVGPLLLLGLRLLRRRLRRLRLHGRRRRLVLGLGVLVLGLDQPLHQILEQGADVHVRRVDEDLGVDLAPLECGEVDRTLHVDTCVRVAHRVHLPAEFAGPGHHEADLALLLAARAEHHVGGHESPRALVVDQDPPLLELRARPQGGVHGARGLALFEVLARQPHRHGGHVALRDALLIVDLHPAVHPDARHVAAEGVHVQPLCLGELQRLEQRVGAALCDHLLQCRLALWRHALDVRDLKERRRVNFDRLHQAPPEVHDAADGVEEA
mmetsp:Transcript_28604/g.75730  ORF Transcript_28604/g.75730 Transcript_28604/m.75730 type:complete len:517 (-) Transcript_28604:540-2090(-)